MISPVFKLTSRTLTMSMEYVAAGGKVGQWCFAKPGDAHVTTRVLLVGRTMKVLDRAREQLDLRELELEAATNAEEVREAFSRGEFAHVFMGAGITLDDRLEIVRAAYEASDAVTMHLKDVASGPEGFLPFTKAILEALSRQ